MVRLIDINSQIEKLQKQAAELRAKEFDTTVKNIITQMNAFEISLEDIKKALVSSTKAKRGDKKRTTAVKASNKSKLSGVKVEPKYRGPAGETWTGRGVMPRWLAEFIKNGRTKEEFAITSPSENNS